MSTTPQPSGSPTRAAHRSRTRKFVHRESQLRWVTMLLLSTGISMFAQGVLLMFLLSRLATELPNDAEQVLHAMPGLVTLAMVLTFAFLTPFTLLVGILVSFRIAGPLHRFETFLRQVIAGERPPDIRLRKGDQLQGLCTLINRATAPVRGIEPADDEEHEAPPSRAVA